MQIGDCSGELLFLLSCEWVRVVDLVDWHLGGG